MHHTPGTTATADGGGLRAGLRRRLGVALTLALLGGYAASALPSAASDPLASAPVCGQEPVGGTGLVCLHEDPSLIIDSGLPTPVLAGDADQADRDKAAILKGRALLPDSADGKPTVTCFGTGTDGARFQAAYVHWSDAPDRTADAVPVIRRFAAASSDVFQRAALAQGGSRVPRWVTETNADGTCTPTVVTVAVPRGTSFPSGTLNEANRKYLSWYDAADLCGVAGIYYDERPGQENNNNTYSSHARVDRGCWGSSGRSVEVHEMLHALGGVQGGAPRSSRAGHCLENGEVLCYNDGAYASTRMEDLCPGTDGNAFDCNADDYWAASPPSGSWIATHWNTYNNRYLGVPGSTGTDLSPVVRIAVGAASGVTTALTATVSVPRGTASTATTTWSDNKTGCSVAKQAPVVAPDGASFTQSAVLTCTVRDAGLARVSLLVGDGSLIGSASRALTLIRGSGTLLVEPRVAVSVDTATVTRDQGVVATVRIVDPHTDSGVALPFTLTSSTVVSGRTRAAVVGRGTTSAGGTATVTLTPAATLGLAAKVARGPRWAAATSPATGVTVSAATTTVTVAVRTGTVLPVVSPGSLSLTGTLTNTSLGAVVPRGRVSLWTRPPGGTWVKAGSAMTNTSGVYAGAVRVTRDVEVQARHEEADNRGSSASPVLSVASAPRVTVRVLPAVRATATVAGKDGVFGGAMGWTASLGSASGFTVALQRLDGSTWTQVMTATTDEKGRWATAISSSDVTRGSFRAVIADGKGFFSSATSPTVASQLAR